MSNEHPDMSGNPMDAPFLCEYCGMDFPEERGVSMPQIARRNRHDDEFLFCSNDCCNDYLESRGP